MLFCEKEQSRIVLVLHGPRNEHIEQFPCLFSSLYGKSTQEKPKLLVYLILLCCRSLRVVKTCLWGSGSWCVSPALYSGRQRSQSRSTHSTEKWKLRIMQIGVLMVYWSGLVAWGAPNEAEGYRGLAQHGGPPGWWPSKGVIFYQMDGPCRLPWRTTPLPWSGADRLLNVHKTPPWVTSRKEGMSWYSSRLMLSLWLPPYSNQ